MSASARFVLSLAISVIAPATNPASQPPSVVVAELFTSEGCSSCPPADALIRQLADAQPLEGAYLIAFEEHVDYWDRLGWRDPFSSAQFTSRQTPYNERVFRSGAIYTPQLVVDGVRVRRKRSERDLRDRGGLDSQAARDSERAVSGGRVASSRDGPRRCASDPRTSRRRRRSWSSLSRAWFRLFVTAKTEVAR